MAGFCGVCAFDNAAADIQGMAFEFQIIHLHFPPLHLYYIIQCDEHNILDGGGDGLRIFIEALG